MAQTRYPTDRLTVIGAGTMGTGIAIAALRGGVRVTIADAFPEAVERSRNNIEAGLTKEGIPDKLELLTTAANVEDACKDATFVIEAISEQIQLKREFFNKIDKIAPPECLFVSNTSTMTIKEISEGCSADRRKVYALITFGAMHFFIPADSVPLVEVVSTPELDKEAFEAMLTMGKEKMGKMVLPTIDVPGFVLNRIIIPALLEVYRMVGRGQVEPDKLDEALEVIGWPPLAMWADRVGSDIWYDILQSSRAREGVENVPESWREEAPLVDRMVKNGALGRKSGRGLYVWDGWKLKGPAKDNDS